MAQPFPLTEGMDETAVGFHVLIVPLDGVVKMSLHFEKGAKLRVSCVECLVGFMVAGEDNFHVERYGLRCETLSTCNTQPLSSLFDHDAPFLECPLQPVIGQIVTKKLDSSED